MGAKKSTLIRGDTSNEKSPRKRNSASQVKDLASFDYLPAFSVPFEATGIRAMTVVP